MAPSISPYTGPGWSPPICRVPLELRSVFPNFTARRSARIHGDHFVSFTDFCVSLTRHSHRVIFLGHLPRRVTGLNYCPPPRSSRTLSFALTCSHDSLILMHPAIDIVWRFPCLPCLRLLGPLAIAVRLVVFTSWLAPSLIPHRDVCLSLPAVDACRAKRLG